MGLGVIDFCLSGLLKGHQTTQRMKPRVSAQQVVVPSWAPNQSIWWTSLCDCVAFNPSYPADTTRAHCFERERASRFYCLLYKRIHIGGGTFESLDDSQVGTPTRCSPVVRMFVRLSTRSIFSCVESIKLLFFQQVCWDFFLCMADQ